MNECECGKKFTAKLVPCPDGLEGCCVAHYDESSFICPSCGLSVPTLQLGGEPIIYIGAIIAEKSFEPKLEEGQHLCTNCNYMFSNDCVCKCGMRRA